VAKYSIDDLRQMQAWPLERKIQVTQTRIIEFLTRLDGNAYVSFSGGKDSTVLLELARRVKPDIDAVFCDTGLEYPEIRDFVKTKENVTWLKPKKRFDEIIKEYGYPVIGKEVATYISEARRDPNSNSMKRLDGTSKKEGALSRYNCAQWAFLLNAPFKIAPNCCYWMKESPMNAYSRGGK
jgi:3'-phosphoadenosine 5'-phosphosulfate sulfotransferase (PAPS reductase)/FAD synthetase